MHEDTIPSQLFPEGESSKSQSRAEPEKPRRVGTLGILIIAALVGLGGLAVAKFIRRGFSARKR